MKETLTPEEWDKMMNDGHIENSTNMSKDISEVEIKYMVDNSKVDEETKQYIINRLNDYSTFKDRFKLYLEIIDDGDLMNKKCKVYDESEELYGIVKSIHDDMYSAIYGDEDLSMVAIMFIESQFGTIMRMFHKYLMEHSATYIQINCFQTSAKDECSETSNSDDGCKYSPTEVGEEIGGDSDDGEVASDD